MGRKVIVTIEHDPDTESPCENDGSWKLHSFSTRHVNFKHPDDFLPPDIGLRRKLGVGLAFLLSYFEHGQGMWMLANSDKSRFGGDWRWDGVDLAGILIWEHPPTDMGGKTMEKRREDAQGFLDEYNAWANGRCYWYSVETEDGEHVDSCGGLIGEEWLAGISASSCTKATRLPSKARVPGSLSSTRSPTDRRNNRSTRKEQGDGKERLPTRLREDCENGT